MRKAIINRFTREERALAAVLTPLRPQCDCGAVPKLARNVSPCIPAGEPLPPDPERKGRTMGHHTLDEAQASRASDRRMVGSLLNAADKAAAWAEALARLEEEEEED
jgi:hypothetical protein